MSIKILDMITNLGVVKVINKSKVQLMSEAENKLNSYFSKLMEIAENTSKSEQDSILLAGAMMAASRFLYYKNLNEDQASELLEQNTIDLVDLVKPTIH